MFFECENQHFPPSLSDLGQQRQGTKSDLLVCFEQCAPSSRERIQVDAMVFDGAVTVHMLKPAGCRIFKEYIEKIYHPYIKLELNKVERLDVVWDRYFPNSLKQSACEKRWLQGTTQRQRTLYDTRNPLIGIFSFRLKLTKIIFFIIYPQVWKPMILKEKFWLLHMMNFVITTGQNTIMDMKSL